MAVLCSDYRLLFIGNTRTGCTALGQALVEQAGGRFLPPERCSLNGEIVSKKHSTVRQLVKHRLLPCASTKLYKFVAVRNPFDSLVSRYFKARYRPNRAHRVCQIEELSFPQFVNCIFPERRPRRMHGKFVAGTDEVIRFEALQEGLSTVMARVGGPDVQIPLVNKTERKSRHYSEYYDDETRDLVASLFAEELERYGYSFEDRRTEAEDRQDAMGLVQ